MVFFFFLQTCYIYRILYFVKACNRNWLKLVAWWRHSFSVVLSMSFHDCFRLGVNHLIVLRTRTCLFVHDQSFLSARNPRARPLHFLLSSRSSIYLSRAMAIVRRLYIRPNEFIPQTRRFDPNKSWRCVDSNPGPLPHVPLDLKLTHALDRSTILAPSVQHILSWPTCPTKLCYA